ncbi:hypothetical protein BMS3Abin15_00620 [bacterium BMS3Abin15]|nr:hypothetical protein BMS3Abin15_00620 [bacterium BMS3Abin15]HDH07479.1 hypothetical protein [Candidatus Moranbacteria bacterium]
MSEILESLFGSKARARILRFFLLNAGEEYQPAEVAKKNMLKKQETRREINNFKKIKFVVERIKKGKKFYTVNTEFSFYPELRNLIVKSNVYPQCKSLGKVKDIGIVKLAVVSGVFLNYSRSKADMILVANNVSRSKLKNLMNSLEAEIGKEINYVLMNSEELKYRLNMTDRFLLEFLRGPHDEIINKVSGLKNLILALKNE